MARQKAAVAWGRRAGRASLYSMQDNAKWWAAGAQRRTRPPVARRTEDPGLNTDRWPFTMTVLEHEAFAFCGLLVYVLVTRIGQHRRQPSAALAWVLVIAMFPYLGVPLFLLFGTRKFARPGRAGARRCLAQVAAAAADAGAAGQGRCRPCAAAGLGNQPACVLRAAAAVLESGGRISHGRAPVLGGAPRADPGCPRLARRLHLRARPRRDRRGARRRTDPRRRARRARATAPRCLRQPAGGSRSAAHAAGCRRRSPPVHAVPAQPAAWPHQPAQPPQAGDRRRPGALERRPQPGGRVLHRPRPANRPGRT